MRILTILGYRSGDTATPIVKIVKQFGFKAYSEQFVDKNLSGDILINGDTNEVYGHDKVIIVNEMDERNHSRSYSELLGSYVNATKRNSYIKDTLKILFFVITIGTLVAVVYFFIIERINNYLVI